MWALVKEMTGEKVLETYFRGKIQVDLIWATKDIDCHAIIFIPLCSLIWDHRVYVVDVTYLALIGEPILNIPQPKGIFLRCSIPKVGEKYLKLLENYLTNNKWKQKLMHYTEAKTSP